MNNTSALVSIIIVTLMVAAAAAIAYATHAERASLGASQAVSPGVAGSAPLAAQPSSTPPILSAPTPAASSSTDLSWEKGMTVVTGQDGIGTKVYLALHERFVIQLGDSLNWSLAFDPPTGISRVPNSADTGGVQGIYEADQIGTTTLRAVGAPICKTGEACPMFMREVEVIFTVR